MCTYPIILVLAAVFAVPSVPAEDIVTCKAGETLVYGICVKYGTQPGDRCDNSFLDCAKIPNTYCSDRKQCDCRWGYELRGTICHPGLGSHCSSSNTNELCGTAYSECAGNNTCVCKTGYIQHMRQCVLKTTALYQGCSLDLQCQDFKNSHCFGGTCQCKPGFDNRGGTCTAGLYAPCDDRTNTCIGSNLQCKNYYCMCDSKSFPNGRDCELFTTALGGACSHYRACDTIGHAICYNNACQCNWNYFEDGVGKCVGGLHAICTSNECQSPNYKCLNRKCVCADNYEESVGKCVPKPTGR